MNKNKIYDVEEKIKRGAETAFIDASITSNLAYKPQFISNNYREGRKVLASIEDELLSCDEFMISVAFVTMSGITPLLQTLKELEKKKIPGKIMTTDYLMFSEPKALDKLAGLKNIELRMYQTEEAGEGFHTKGYIFRSQEVYRIIVGSSNMTLSALTKNREWNTRIISTQQGEYAQHVLEEYRELWNSRYTVSYEQFRESYRLEYEKNRIQREVIRKQKEIARKKEIPSIVQYRLHPNKMQVEFIRNLKELREYGAERALLISATGTGKTYASAFAMRELGFRRVLFLVHRGQLARQTKKAYEMVFDSTVSMGLVGGGYHEYEKDYIFATVQTLNRDEHLLRYCPDEFDCIILDEAHHSSADTYQRVMHYFRPKLWLGMTATPDKRDDNIEGRNIYEIFDHQIAYEIRLQQAMEENMLCPFHYFGISDLSMVDDRDRKSKKMTEKDFQYLTGTERVKHIIEQANYYGYSGERVKGLIFCSRIDESIALSEKFNEAGFRTIALNGSASEEERAEAFERLAMDEQDATEARQPLDYIFSVEILNEGVDIVEVNQVIMLRPTESPIVFIQQLGRGLRKSEGKEYVVVLDFIGNYKNNFMIPIALSGDRSYNKDNIRRYLLEGGRVIPGESTIHFDEVSRKQIFASVDNANFSDIKLIRENYTNLKNKLGKIPGLLDFDQYGEMDVLRIFDNHSLGSYYKFLVKYEKEYQVRLTKDEENIIEFVSKKLANGKRIHELAMLNRILLYAHGFKKMHVFSELKKTLSEEYGRTMDEKQKENLVSMMTNEFPAGTGKKTYEKCVFIEPDQDGEYQIAPSFLAMLEDNVFYQMLRELVAFGISRYQRDYSNTYKDTNFVLYQKYTYEDVCRLLNWEKNEVPLNIGGYKFDKKTGTFPVFINYDKAENISDTTKYEDHFISSSSLVAISKSGRSLESEDVQNFLKAKERGIQVELFVRKNKDDKISKEFYYLGHMNASGKAREFTMPNTTKTAVEIEWILEEPVREDLYQYIVNE